MTFLFALRSIFIRILCMINNEENTRLQEPRPWGLGATIGFSVIVLVVLAIIESVFFLAFYISDQNKDSSLDKFQVIDNLAGNGFIGALATFVSVPFGIGLIILFAYIRKGITVKKYLGFSNPGFRTILKWSLAAIILDVLTNIWSRPIVPDVMVDIYTSARFPILIWLDIVVFTPVWEELFFRGFLFEGLRTSKLKNTGTIIITSLIWALLHPQYNTYEIFTIFLSGLLLGIAKVKSNSIYTPIIMHMVSNALAMIVLIIYLVYFRS